MDSYLNSLELGASFKDISEAVEGLGGSMGKMVNPSQEVLETIVATSKATGITTKDVGNTVGEMQRLLGNQKASLEMIHKIGDSARKSGLSSKALITSVTKSLKDVSGFGFKSGIDGLTKMAKQAAILRTTMESIGAKKLASDVLDPEKAIETAAAFQMMGGAVGKLADPFQLLHRAPLS